MVDATRQAPSGGGAMFDPAMDRRWRAALGLLAALVPSACSSKSDDESGSTLPRAELIKPETCQECHADHYREWSGSMHAYSADDPVFRAMNRRGQEETQGALGDFCVRCHAPMALHEAATTDGLNLDDVPAELHGVTCYFCHDAVRVTDTHNAPIELADDTTLRGGIGDPVDRKSTRLNSSHLGN